LSEPMYPSIPIPYGDIASLLEAVMALKRNVEALTQEVQGSQPPPRVFIQKNAPKPTETTIKVGDLWISQARQLVSARGRQVVNPQKGIEVEVPARYSNAHLIFYWGGTWIGIA
jgi:hypothetical protein